MTTKYQYVMEYKDPETKQWLECGGEVTSFITKDGQYTHIDKIVKRHIEVNDFPHRLRRVKA